MRLRGVRTSSDLTHQDVHVVRRVGKPKRFSFWRVGGAPAGPRFGVHDNCLSNLHRGVMERVFYVQTEGRFVELVPPSLEEWRRRLSPFDRDYASHVKHAKPIEMDSFPLLYRSRRRGLYTRAVESLRHRPLEPCDSRLRIFVKKEKLNFTEKVDPAPRVIFPRDPRYNVAVGLYLKPLEHPLYHSLNRLFGARVGAHPVTVAKGLNFAERGRVLYEKWSRFRDPCALLFDAKRFDQHVSVPALRWEHSVYAKWFSALCRSHLCRLLRQQLTMVARGYCPDGKLWFTKAGGRCSGDMNTACGNVLIMCGLFYSFLDGLGLDYEFLDDGDDSVLILERRDVDRVLGGIGWFDGVGFEMKLGPIAYRLEEVEFCQTRPVFDGCRWTMMRDPRVCVAKDCLCLLGQDDLWSWHAAVANCGEAAFGGLPILDAVYRWFRRMSGGASPCDDAVMLQESGTYWMSVGMRRRFGPVSDAARISVWNAFRIEPSVQCLIEDYYEGLTCPRDLVVLNAAPSDPAYLYGTGGCPLLFLGSRQ